MNHIEIFSDSSVKVSHLSPGKNIVYIEQNCTRGGFGNEPMICHTTEINVNDYLLFLA